MSRAKGTPAAANKNNTLLVTDDSSAGRDAKLASLVMGCVTGNAVTARSFAKGIFGELSITECCNTLKEDVELICGGDLKQVEGALIAQSVSLNAIFNEMARRAALNMGEHLEATDRYMRLALKAQSQCRATLETLANIKNPPIVFARQANISTGAQQVNNTVAATSHAEKTQSRQNELLEDQRNGSTQLDTRATAAPARSHTAVETVAAVHRAARRKG